MSKDESKTVRYRKLIEADSKFLALPLVLELNIYTFLPVNEVLSVLPLVSKLFQQNCKIFSRQLAPELIMQHLRSTQSQIPLQSRLAEEEHSENYETTEKVCFRFNFVSISAVLVPLGINYVAPKGSPWHDTLNAAYTSVLLFALGVVAFRFLSPYFNNRQSRQKNHLEKQVKNLSKLSIVIESKNQENKNNNCEELPAMRAEEKLNASSCQLRPFAR